MYNKINNNIDVDECSLKTDDCHNNATCTDTDGSYSCNCTTGFTGDGFTCSSMNLQFLKNKLCCVYPFYSSDINECDNGDACSVFANCTDTEGSYYCNCTSGYSGDGHTCSSIQLDVCYCYIINNVTRY